MTKSWVGTRAGVMPPLRGRRRGPATPCTPSPASLDRYDKIMGGDEGGGDAAVKRQAEGASNPMYALANLIGQVWTNYP
jgi:hypothetical protein